MKNYELIERLMELPAGYEIELGRTVTTEDMNGQDTVYFSGTVEDIDVADADRRIMLFS